MHRFSKLDYTIYSVKDFLMDEEFIDFLNYPKPIETKFWTDWEKEHALVAQNYLEAINLHKELKNQVDLMSAGSIDLNWEDLNRRLSHMEGESSKVLVPINEAFVKVIKEEKNFPQLNNRLNLTSILFVLSSLVFIIFSVLLINSDIQSPITVTTSNGQIARISFPDGSQVTINSNTIVSYSTKGLIFKDRVVDLDGEAFFEVSKRKSFGRRLDFKVVTKPASITVTGTSFNVASRNKKLNVFLKEGSIILNTPINGSIGMKEGDAVSINESGNLSIEKNSNNNLHLAWMENKLIFEQTPFSKIIESIEALYGVKVDCKSKSLLTKTFTGVLPADEKSILLSALRATFNLSIIDKNDIIVITQK